MTKKCSIKMFMMFFCILFNINAADLQGHIALYPNNKGAKAVERVLGFREFQKIRDAIQILGAEIRPPKSALHMSISTEFNAKLVHDITECALTISQDDQSLITTDENKGRWSSAYEKIMRQQKDMKARLTELEAKFHRELSQIKSNFVTAFKIDELKVLTPEHGGDKKKWLVLMLSPKEQKTKLSDVIFPGNLHISLAKIVSDSALDDDEFEEAIAPLIAALNKKIKKLNKEQFINFNTVTITRNFCDEQLVCLQHDL